MIAHHPPHHVHAEPPAASQAYPSIKYPPSSAMTVCATLECVIPEAAHSDLSVAILLDAPPCGTPEAAQVNVCVKWAVRLPAGGVWTPASPDFPK